MQGSQVLCRIDGLSMASRKTLDLHVGSFRVIYGLASVPGSWNETKSFGKKMLPVGFATGVKISFYPPSSTYFLFSGESLSPPRLPSR